MPRHLASDLSLIQRSPGARILHRLAEDGAYTGDMENIVYVAGVRANGHVLPDHVMARVYAFAGFHRRFRMPRGAPRVPVPPQPKQYYSALKKKDESAPWVGARGQAWTKF